MHTRICPSCEKEITYSHKGQFLLATHFNNECQKCKVTKVNQENKKRRQLGLPNLQSVNLDKSGNIPNRSCPKCNSTIQYKTWTNYLLGNDANSICKTCVANQSSKNFYEDVKNGRKSQPFKGEKHTAKTKAIMSQKVKQAYLDGRCDFNGEKNGMYGKTGELSHFYGKSTYDWWLKKYGREEADRLLVEFKKKISIATSGSNNPMYGRPVPNGSGNGWKGWYKEWYFRSLLELTYLINVIERFGLKWKSAESIRIKYIDPLGNERTYAPDFLIEDKYLVEIKPKKLQNTPLVLAKKNAAEQYCKEHGLIYKVTHPLTLLNKDEILNNNNIQLLEKYKIKLEIYDIKSGGK